MKLPATPEQLYKRVNDFYRPLLEAATTRVPHSLPQASSFRRASSDPPILIGAVAVNVTRFGAVPSSQKQDDVHPVVRQPATTRPEVAERPPHTQKREMQRCVATMLNQNRKSHAVYRPPDITLIGEVVA
jgi:hypothetical protein